MLDTCHWSWLLDACYWGPVSSLLIISEASSIQKQATRICRIVATFKCFITVMAVRIVREYFFCGLTDKPRQATR